MIYPILEIGKSYRTREGRLVKCTAPIEGVVGYNFIVQDVENEMFNFYTYDGYYLSSKHEQPKDIILPDEVPKAKEPADKDVTEWQRFEIIKRLAPVALQFVLADKTNSVSTNDVADGIFQLADAVVERMYK